jgi:hypothetical protein
MKRNFLRWIAATGVALWMAGSAPAQTGCSPGASNASNFNGTSIKGGSYIWFNANFSARGIPSSGATIFFTNSSVTFTADQPYTVTVPNAQITFSPSAVCSSTSFDTANNRWVTTVPISGSDEIFLSGVAFPVPANFDHVQGAVAWNGAFSSDTAGLSVAWKWGAAVYTTFTTDYNGLGVKPTHTATCVYNNSDHAGTPQGVDTASGEPYKSFVTGGARGGGGSNWTGSWSGTQGVSVCVKTQAMFCLTIQKEFNDGISVSPDLLGWGMNVTDPFGVTTHYVTDAQSGQVSVSHLPVGTYTVAEDPSGPIPPGCIGPLFNPFQAFVNGVAQTPGPVTFTVKSEDKVSVVFINLIGCGG